MQRPSPLVPRDPPSGRVKEIKMTRKKKQQFVEQCWTLVGHQRGSFWYARRRRPTKGSPHEVSCDAAWTLEREEEHQDAVGFFHTHPPGAVSLSDRDVRTMQGWVSAFGKPLLCFIECEGRLMAYRFDSDDSLGKQLVSSERFPRGIIVALDDQKRGVT